MINRIADDTGRETVRRIHHEGGHLVGRVAHLPA
ncbi:MAG: hypothetical protein QOH97_208 [Actinoplanes sp.]|jgi:hypothetical protein|nr:hypothetical protein [Actinoplanes sp.]